MPATSLLTSIGCGASGWRREKASKRWVSDAARSAPRIAPSANRRISSRLSPARWRRSSRLPVITCSRLLKSCATPPVSCPTASIFCAWRSASCAFSRSIDFGFETDNRRGELLCAPLELVIRPSQRRLTRGQHPDDQRGQGKDQGDEAIARRTPPDRIGKGLDVDRSERRGPLLHRGSDPQALASNAGRCRAGPVAAAPDRGRGRNQQTICRSHHRSPRS